MNLVNELQVSAERDDVLTALRKARRLTSKLGVNDIDEWLKSEQNGYSDLDRIPSYRQVKGTLVMHAENYIPAGYGQLMRGTMSYPGNIVLDHPCNSSMGEILAHIDSIENKNCDIHIKFDGGSFNRLRQGLHPMIANQVEFMLKLSSAQVKAIPEAVKDKILDWACELERNGVHGENMTFNDAEKQAAHAITFNISNSTIEQLTNSGINRKGA